MNNSNELQILEDIASKWQGAKGIGSVYLSKNIDPNALVHIILKKIYTKTPTANVVIVVDNFNDRIAIINFITKFDNDIFKDLINNKKIRVVTPNVIDKINMWDIYLTITVAVNYYNDPAINLCSQSKFKLIIVNGHTDTINNVFIKFPLIAKFGEDAELMMRVNSPVEENRYAVDISSADRAKLDEYNKYIQSCCNVFGSFDNIEFAKNGNAKLNISAEQVRFQIATNNGWAVDLNMTYPFNQEIDKVFNPNALLERANTVYNIIRERANLLSDNEAKLDAIVELVKANKDKKILIINKRKEFADKVAEAINNNIANTNYITNPNMFNDEHTVHTFNICYAYHDDLPSIEAFNDKGEQMFVKSGVSKGQIKMMGSKAQKTLYQSLFNKGYINVLSANNACDKDLECEIDMMIVTSPLCNDVKALKYRLSNVRFKSNPNIVYKLYVVDSMEEKHLDKEVNQIVKNCETSARDNEFNNIGID